jgi:hypothetical protein
MSYETARSDIVEYLKANFLTTQIDYENSSAGELPLPFIQVAILDGTAVGLALQYQSIQYPGIISINIWDKQGVGTVKSNQIADELVALFTNKTIGTVETKAPYRTVLGETNGRYQTSVTVPFERRSQ